MDPKHASFFDYGENEIKITGYEVLGKLPDLFTMKDGRKVSSAEEWPERRKEIWKDAVELQYGTMPPKPEVFSVTPAYKSKTLSTYRIIAGTKEKQVQLMFGIFAPKVTDDRKPPIVVDGDMCFRYPFNEEVRNTLLERGIAYASFDRTSLANDIKHEGRRQGPLYDIYPEYTFGALGAWAWGYSRVADALEIIGGYDLDYLAFTGHSRGGKTCMLAGVLDQRAKIVNPNNTNAGSCSCYRVHMSAIKSDGTEARNETLKDLWTRFGYWIGEGMGAYADDEASLPFDCHFLKALIAPRTFLLGEAADDIWTNPLGSYATSVRATEVFRLLGCEENMLWYFRRGEHSHKPVDFNMLADVIHNRRDGTPLDMNLFYRIPFKVPDNFEI